MSRPFLRLTGLLFVASLEIGVGIYRRYAPPEPERPQVSFAAHLAGVVSGITFGLVILRNYEQKLSERRAWWVTIFLLLGVSTVAFLYQRLRRNPTFTLFCTGHDCPIAWKSTAYLELTSLDGTVCSALKHLCHKPTFWYLILPNKTKKLKYNLITAKFEIDM